MLGKLGHRLVHCGKLPGDAQQVTLLPRMLGNFSAGRSFSPGDSGRLAHDPEPVGGHSRGCWGNSHDAKRVIAGGSMMWCCPRGCWEASPMHQFRAEGILGDSPMVKGNFP